MTGADRCALGAGNARAADKDARIIGANRAIRPAAAWHRGPAQRIGPVVHRQRRHGLVDKIRGVSESPRDSCHLNDTILREIRNDRF